jgi:hypothetical protein
MIPDSFLPATSEQPRSQAHQQMATAPGNAPRAARQTSAVTDGVTQRVLDVIEQRGSTATIKRCFMDLRPQSQGKLGELKDEDDAIELNE